MKKIRIPATTANMGSGFDTLGMALKLYNILEVEKLSEGIEITDRGKPFGFPDRENLIYTSLLKALSEYDYKLKGLRLNLCECNVPLSRGLGSSATCIVGGIMAAGVVMGIDIPKEKIINIATSIEGHPDNVVPAAVGGMTISINNPEGVIYSKVNVSDKLKFFVIIPELSVSTNSARKVLPISYSREDCIFNISRSAMLVNAMNNGEFDKLRVSTQDKLHQPYRKQFIENIDEIFSKAQSFGSLSEFISGSGSTMISIINSENVHFETSMKSYLSTLKENYVVKILEVDLDGATIN